MCGILVASGPTAPVTSAQAEAALDAMAARGPDARRIHLGDRVVAGHLRLAIQDPVPAADQPMWDPAGRRFIVFNGEVYNPEDLRSSLGDADPPLTTRCDTELLLRTVVRDGIDRCLDQVRGMYAFAVVDADTGALVAARDELGQKPLYWRRVGDGLALASSIPALLALGGQPTPDDTSYALYFSTHGFTAEDRTFFDGIRCLPAGHILEWDGAGEPRIRRRFAVWDMLDRGMHALPPPERVERVRQALQASVRRHLVGDVPMGVLLSGGIDSALVWAYAHDVTPELTAFTKLSPGIEEIPEDVIPKILADRPAPWVRVPTTPTDYLDGMAQFIAWSGQPSRWGGGPPMTQVAQEAADRDVKVLLGGDGADEVMGGYKTYRKRFAQWSGDTLELGELLRSAPAGRLYDEADVAPFYERQRAVRGDILAQLEFVDDPASAYVTASLTHDTAVFLQCCNLPHSDAWSMAASVELRNPLIDLQVVSAGLNLPVDPLVPPSKRILRSLAQQDVGPWFDVPKEGTRNYSRAVSDPAYWRPGRFAIAERRSLPKDPSRAEMFKLINLELFHRRFFLGDEDPWEELLTEAGGRQLRPTGGPS